ncbi:BPL-N domain-containing protein [Streptomyces rubellomurinus]|uniref:BPL-N domain-containing protein n=1 Tax=Streptomyces rubellomurinus (strain ATCC 31215) TaxID=359131 RepID=UPI000696EB3A|nr:BPL-N domain-containing protein [Streptomyces rubellomurinus]
MAAAVLAASACTAAPTPNGDGTGARPAAVSAGADAADGTPPAAGRPLALVYRGPAACDGCAEAARQMLEREGYGVRYIGAREQLHFGADAFAGAALYVQPGGTNGQEVSTAWRLLQHETGFSPDLVRDFVRAGGHYLGLCMGGYLAGDPGYDLLPGDSGQYIHSPGASITDEHDHLVDVAWRGQNRRMYFQDGPYFDVHGPGVDVLARYSNNRAAAVVAPYGAGRVAVSGPHPEAPSDWYDDYDLTDESTTGRVLGADLLHTLTPTAPPSAP